MNPNKHKPTRWKDLELCKNCGDKEFGPDVVDRKTGLCAECLVGALERENRTMAKGVAIIVKENNELRTQVKKAEAKLAAIEKKEISTTVKVGFEVREVVANYEAKLATIEKDLRERRLTQYELLLEHFPAVKAKEPELCGVCGGKRGLCLCLEGTPKKVRK